MDTMAGRGHSVGHAAPRQGIHGLASLEIAGYYPAARSRDGVGSVRRRLKWPGLGSGQEGQPFPVHEGGLP